MANVTPPPGTNLEDVTVVEEAADVAALEALPTASRVLGLYPKAQERGDIFEKDADGTWNRDGGSLLPPLDSADFVVFPIPVLRIGPHGSIRRPNTALAEVPADAEAEATAWHRGDWMQTFTGRKFYPMDPQPEDVDPEDIAHSLGMQCRFNGHTDEFYSVAEHCVLMSYVVPDHLALWALLHDGTEAYVGDMVRPLKLSQPSFVVAEDRVMVAIAARFNLDIATTTGPNGEVIVLTPPEVKEADTRILLNEKRAFMNHGSNPWYVDSLEPLELDPDIQGWSPRMATAAWLDRFSELTQRGSTRGQGHTERAGATDA